jgi:hypothetical protein
MKRNLLQMCFAVTLVGCIAGCSGGAADASVGKAQAAPVVGNAVKGKVHRSLVGAPSATASAVPGEAVGIPK